MVNGRKQVIKIGRYYYVGTYNSGTTLDLTSNIQQAKWFDTSGKYAKERMTELCVDYGGATCDLVDELQPDSTKVAE